MSCGCPAFTCRNGDFRAPHNSTIELSRCGKTRANENFIGEINACRRKPCWKF